MKEEELVSNLLARNCMLIGDEVPIASHSLDDVFIALMTEFSDADRYIACIPILLLEDKDLAHFGTKIVEKNLQNLTGYFISEALDSYKRMGFQDVKVPVIKRLADWLHQQKLQGQFYLPDTNLSRCSLTSDQRWGVKDYNRSSDFDKMMKKYMQMLSHHG